MDPTTKELDDFNEEVPMFDRDGFNEEAEMREKLRLAREKNRARAIELYEIAAAADTGSMIQCPMCGVKFEKATYHKNFCSNRKTAKSANNCKDNYWNLVRTR